MGRRVGDMLENLRAAHAALVAAAELEQDALAPASGLHCAVLRPKPAIELPQPDHSAPSAAAGCGVREV